MTACVIFNINILIFSTTYLPFFCYSYFHYQTIFCPIFNLPRILPSFILPLLPLTLHSPTLFNLASYTVCNFNICLHLTILFSFHSSIPVSPTFIDSSSSIFLPFNQPIPVFYFNFSSILPLLLLTFTIRHYYPFLPYNLSRCVSCGQHERSLLSHTSCFY